MISNGEYIKKGQSSTCAMVNSIFKTTDKMLRLKENILAHQQQQGW